MMKSAILYQINTDGYFNKFSLNTAYISYKVTSGHDKVQYFLQLINFIPN